METVYNGKAENKIIRRLFLKSEVSWGISDFSKAIGPIIDLFFVSRFIGIDGVTVLGYMSPLIMFFELFRNSERCQIHLDLRRQQSDHQGIINEL